QEEQHVEPLEEHRIDGEEVASHDAAGLNGQELLPGRAGPTGRRVDTGVAQNLPYGTGRDVIAEPNQFALHAAMPPGGGLGRQPQDQSADARVDRWPAGPDMREGPVASDQLAVPAKERGRSDEERRPAVAGE